MIDRQDLAAVIVSGKLSQSSTLKGPRNTLLLYFDTHYRKMYCDLFLISRGMS